MEGKRLVPTCTLTMNYQEIPTQVPIDCVATGIAFMDQDCHCHHVILHQELKEKNKLRLSMGDHLNQKVSHMLPQ